MNSQNIFDMSVSYTLLFGRAHELSVLKFSPNYNLLDYITI